MTEHFTAVEAVAPSSTALAFVSEGQLVPSTDISHSAVQSEAESRTVAAAPLQEEALPQSLVEQYGVQGRRRDGAAVFYNKSKKNNSVAGSSAVSIVCLRTCQSYLIRLLLGIF